MAPPASSSPTLDLSVDPEAARAAALAALDRGALVILPTETVYGIAGREDRPEALERLARLKQQRTSPFSLAVDGVARLEDRLLPLTGPAARVAARWWPGPVTQVLAARQGPSLGVRVVGHAWTRSLLAACPSAVLLPSANRPGEPAPRALSDLDAGVAEQAAVVVDGGRCALGESSTVVEAGRATLAVLREGVVSRADLQRHALGRVLVVCSGNTCRSPMAAALLRRALERRAGPEGRLLLPEVGSAGTWAREGSGASRGALRALRSRGLDLSEHSSRPFATGLLERCDLVLGMTREHLEAARSGLGELPVPLELFDPAGAEVEDPFGGSPADYEACAATLERMAEARAATLCPRLPGDDR